jgi:uncharacterized phage protein (TIGR01671 family)
MKNKFRYIWQSPEKATKKYEYTLEELEKQDVSYVIADYEASGWILLGKLQFTGLYDKNGKEIYEGDIVRHKDKREGKDQIMVCEWGDVNCSSVGFIWKKIHKGLTTMYNPTPATWMFEEWEVIGNINESPELIKYINI